VLTSKNVPSVQGVKDVFINEFSRWPTF